MTEAKKNTKTQSSDNRISTHPSYTEYSWDALVGSKQTAHKTETSKMTASAASAGATITAPSSQAKKTAGSFKGGIAKTKLRKHSSVSAPAAKESAESVVIGTDTAEKKAKAKTKKKVSIHTITVEKKYSFPISVVFLSLCFTLLIVAIITTAVQINEITQVNSSLERKYNTLVSDENELRLLLETRDDLRVVEQMAKEELGMVKIDQVERHYLTVAREDKIEIIEETKDESTGIFDSIADLGSSIVERIRRFFGM